MACCDDAGVVLRPALGEATRLGWEAERRVAGTGQARVRGSSRKPDQSGLPTGVAFVATSGPAAEAALSRRAGVSLSRCVRQPRRRPSPTRQSKAIHEHRHAAHERGAVVGAACKDRGALVRQRRWSAIRSGWFPGWRGNSAGQVDQLVVEELEELGFQRPRTSRKRRSRRTGLRLPVLTAPGAKGEANGLRPPDLLALMPIHRRDRHGGRASTE